MSIQHVPLQDVCDLSMGQAPDGDSYNTTGDGHPLIAGAGDFGDLTPQPKKFTTTPTKLSRIDDIVLCIRATIGDRNWSDGVYCLGRGVAGLRSDPVRLDQRYLWHWLGSSADMLRSKGRGATFLQVNRSDIGSMLIPLPPLPEQRRIAAILDKADALRVKRREAIAKLDRLLQSVFLEMFGDPVTNPKGWRTRRFTEVGQWKSGATPSKANHEFWGGTIPWVSPKDMKVSHIRDAQDHVTDAAFSATSLKRIDPGHLLIVVRGMILAHSFPTAINEVPISINQDMKAIEPANDLDVTFLKAAVDSLKATILSGVSSAGHGTRRLDSRDASEVMIPIPPRERQGQFKAITTVMLELKALHVSQANAADTLFRAAQTNAFGER